ncbi:MAG: peptidoglycan bridge formation glycyltransferase FemA/FemB family protein [Candidatus Coatesbacteria bacterium]|nr:peptidoglycan bridge formation glycyltransferase FemA/FemB family protein [Candidatus Coatesbacteria bacterium]
MYRSEHGIQSQALIDNPLAFQPLSERVSTPQPEAQSPTPETGSVPETKPDSIRIDPPSWDEDLARLSTASPGQLTPWARLKVAYGYDALRLGLYDGERPRVLGQVLRRRLPLTGWNWLYCPYGPALEPGDASGMTAWLEALFAQPFLRRGAALTLEPRLIHDAACERALRSRGFLPGRQSIQPRGTLLLDLSPEPEELMAAMERRTRYNVRLAERRGVEVRLVNSRDGVDAFSELLDETTERQRFLAHQREYYRRVQRLFGPAGSDVMLAYYDGEPVAGVFLLYAGSNAFYVYGASSRRHAKHKGTQYLQWRAILRARERGCSLYDFWGAPVEPVEGHPLWGVYKFKKGFGGEHTVFCGPYERSLSPVGGWLWRHGLPLFRKARNLLLRGGTADVLD